MKLTKLRGWNVAAQKIRITEQGENGQSQDADGWTLVFTEVLPGTGDQFIFEMGKDVRDYIVRELTGGVILAGGDLPKL